MIKASISFVFKDIYTCIYKLIILKFIVFAKKLLEKIFSACLILKCAIRQNPLYNLSEEETNHLFLQN